MVSTSDLNSGDFRLLEVDHRLVVPINTHVRILVTGADVLHSFAVPALGIKTDAVPGRLNQAGLFIKKTRNVLWSMLRNLWGEPLFYAYCNRGGFA